MHLSQYLLGVVTLVEICTTVVAPVLEHSELLKPGEDRPEARSISLSVSATELIANLKAGGKAILQSPRKFESSRHQGHLSSSLSRALSLEHW